MVLLSLLSSPYESTTFSYSWAWLAAPAFPCIRFRSLTYATLFNECLLMMDELYHKESYPISLLEGVKFT